MNLKPNNYIFSLVKLEMCLKVESFKPVKNIVPRSLSMNYDSQFESN